MITVIPPKVNKMEKDLVLFPEKAKRIYGKAVRVAGQKYRDHTKKMKGVSAPRDGYNAKGMPADRGNLRRSIRSRKISTFAAGVGIGQPAKKYGKYVHEGYTHRGGRPIKGRPFFQWSLDLGAKKIIDDIMIAASKLLP